MQLQLFQLQQLQCFTQAMQRWHNIIIIMALDSEERPVPNVISIVLLGGRSPLKCLSIDVPCSNYLQLLAELIPMSWFWTRFKGTKRYAKYIQDAAFE